MSTTETVLLIIVTALLSLFIIMCIAVAVAAYKLVQSIKLVVSKAEDAIDSVESAAEVLKDAQGRAMTFKLLKNIYNLVNRSRK